MPWSTRVSGRRRHCASRACERNFRTGGARAIAVDGLSYHVDAGETLAIVGESGSGKSVTSLAVMGLVPDPPGRVTAGEVWFEGRDLLTLTEREMQAVRGNKISMIFQEPMTSLNPVLSIGRQMTEGIIEHTGASEREARERALEMLRRVHIPAPEKRLREFPHQLSGGMLQRVMIAIALSCNPAVLIADEPTTALDVTIQAQILDIMRELKSELGTAIVLITHDMGVVAEMADRVIIMYAGRKVEEGGVQEIFANPRHPYTRGLLAALPALGRAGPVGSTRLNEIPGIVPALTDLPPGCRFAARCDVAVPRCRGEYPRFEEVRPGQWAACWQSHTLPEGIER
ncbi:MAG: ABC transporter ATP-binding protein [Gammaproteobacteria bacterium]|nr:ABC transporter ATP-binding protein [Gammaproteobacteria bacterium]